jgi:hypothetical protein
VSSAQQRGKIPLVEIVSQLGGTCRLANPWHQDVEIYRNGQKAESLSGKLLELRTAKGETVVVVPIGSQPRVARIP